MIELKPGVRVKLKDGITFTDYTPKNAIYDPGPGTILYIPANRLGDPPTCFVRFDRPIPGRRIYWNGQYVNNIDECVLSDLIPLGTQPTKLTISLELTDWQVNKLLGIIQSHCDRGPYREGWRSPEMQELVELVTTSINTAKEEQ